MKSSNWSSLRYFECFSNAIGVGFVCLEVGRRGKFGTEDTIGGGNNRRFTCGGWGTWVELGWEA